MSIEIKNTNKKIFLDKLPKWGYGRNKGQINWTKSVGFTINFIYKNIQGKVTIINYKSPYLYIQYLNENLFKIKTNNFKNCRLGAMLHLKTNKFKIQVGQIFKDINRDIIITDKKYIIDKNGKKQKYYKYKCNKCGFECGEHYRKGKYEKELWVIESGLLYGHGCACCCNPSIIVVENINSIVAKEETQWMIQYFTGGYDVAKKYTPASNQLMNFICPHCGNIKNNLISINNLYRQKSIGCVCGDGFSYGHKYIFNLLTQLNIEFLDNYTFDWCKFFNPYKNRIVKGQYDFVIKDMSLIIEIDGGFHRKHNTMNNESKEESIFLDNKKNELAKNFNYEIIRLIYKDDLKMHKIIVESELNKLCDLSNINWEQCNKFALNNLIKQICNIKHNNPNMSTGDISKITKLNYNTITKYLKQGETLGWCSYNTQIAKSKVSSKNGKSHCKKVEIFKDHISLGVFNSCVELSNTSFNLFGIHLLKSKIAAVARGERNMHKGFTFKYI